MMITQLDFELMVEPVIIQDAETGQDTLSFAYPVEAHRAPTLSWIHYLHLRWSEIM